jgi:NTP pyrophosphatase (non-canonical NTP hydrolase)
MQLTEFQRVLHETFFRRDAERGLDGTFRWLVEEVGELARALRHENERELVHEFADVLAWLGSLANLAGVDLDRAADRYARGCPRCGGVPCVCEPR